MGALIDSTYFISAERSGLTPSQALRNLQRILPGQELGISVISIMEMAHGEARAENLARATARYEFLNALMASLTLHPVSPLIARRAGYLDGILNKQGNKIAFPDLLIGVTALELRLTLVTRNLRHFRRIPNLTVVQH